MKDYNDFVAEYGSPGNRLHSNMVVLEKLRSENTSSYLKMFIFFKGLTVGALFCASETKEE